MRATGLLALVVGVVLLAGSVALGVRGHGERQAAVDQALSDKAGDSAAQLEDYFARARVVALITAHSPSFRDFYAVPGSREEKVLARGADIREAESSLEYLERLYPSSIGEACFIDRSGPENARYVDGKRAAFDDLSLDETGAPFFKPTFALQAGQVYHARPYVSPDTKEWVISNSTPVPGTGYPAKAIVHFEITIESFRRAALAVAGDDEVAIVDTKTGRAVVDSRSPQRVGAPLGRPADKRFVGLVGAGDATGKAVFSDHRGVFQRLKLTDDNANDWYVVALDSHKTGTFLREAGWAPLGMAASALALLFLAAVGFRSSTRARHEDERMRAVERDYHQSQGEFTEIMQVTRDEDEAYRLLKRHLESSLPGSEVLVLNRNNSHDRLEPVTPVPPGSPLVESLKVAEPDSCLAVRLGKPHERGDDREALLMCDLCGVTSANSTCVPSLVGGEVIGSVLVQHPAPLDEASRRKVEESLTQAAPVLANLRNLALSQARALTDGLTGLPNRRALDDTLKRMSAHADRTATPLCAVLFDLDDFKQINDVYGHEKGDEVLAAVGIAVTANVRASDFAGRHGGEEFVLLLPDTDRNDGATVAEKVRAAISQIEVVGVPRPITASFGVAAIPTDGTEPTVLMRTADRALYVAKASGKNCVATLPVDAPTELAAATT